MQTLLPLRRSLLRHSDYLHRTLSSLSSSHSSIVGDKITAAVVFERLPLIVPKINPTFYAFQQFSFRWGKASGKKMTKKGQEKQLHTDQAIEKSEAMLKDNCEIEYNRVPWSGNADESYNKRSSMRALDKRLYLLLYGCPLGSISKKPVWHFPEKVYESEATLRECAELALKNVIGDLSNANFIGNAPMAHMIVKQIEGVNDVQPFKRFFFKSHVVGLNKFSIDNCEDFVWVTKEELMEYFPDQADFLKKLIVSCQY